MSKSNRRKFYSKMDSKFTDHTITYSRRSIAGSIIPALGLPRCYAILEVADTFGIWLELSYSSILEDQKVSSEPSGTLSDPIKNEAKAFEEICLKYGIGNEEHQRRAEAALLIKRLGTKGCYHSLNNQSEFSAWLNDCNTKILRKTSVKGKRKRNRNAKRIQNRKIIGLLNEKQKGKYIEAITRHDWSEAKQIRNRAEAAAEKKSTEKQRAKEHRRSKKERARRKGSKNTEQPPTNKTKSSDFEVVADGKIKVSRDWLLKHTKHQLEDEDEKILRRGTPKI